MEKDIGHTCILHISLRFEVSFLLIWELLDYGLWVWAFHPSCSYPGAYMEFKSISIFSFYNLEQYPSSDRSDQKGSWAEQRRCRSWAVSDIYSSQPFPEVICFYLLFVTCSYQGKADWCLLLLSKNFSVTRCFYSDILLKSVKTWIVYAFLSAGRDDRTDVRRLGESGWSWVVTLDSRWHRYFCPYSLCR